MRCPLCAGDNDDSALVCRGCGRDIAVPPELLAERDLLRAKRDELERELSGLQARLGRLMRPR